MSASDVDEVEPQTPPPPFDDMPPTTQSAVMSSEELEAPVIHAEVKEDTSTRPTETDIPAAPLESSHSLLTPPQLLTQQISADAPTAEVSPSSDDLPVVLSPVVIHSGPETPSPVAPPVDTAPTDPSPVGDDKRERPSHHLTVATGNDQADINATTLIHSSPSAMADEVDFGPNTPQPIRVDHSADDDEVKVALADGDNSDGTTAHFYVSPLPVTAVDDNDDFEFAHHYTPAPETPAANMSFLLNSSHPIPRQQDESDAEENDDVADLLEQKTSLNAAYVPPPPITINTYSHNYLNTGESDESEPGMDLASPAVVGEVDDFRRANSVMSHISDASNYAYNYGTMDSDNGLVNGPYMVPISPMGHASPMPMSMSHVSYQQTMSQRSPLHNPTYSYQYIDAMSPMATMHQTRNLLPPGAYAIDQHQYASLSSPMDMRQHSPHRMHHRNMSNSSFGSHFGPVHSPPSYDEIIVNSPEGYTPTPYQSPPVLIIRANGEEKEGVEGAIEGQPVPADDVARFAAVNSPSVSSVVIPVNGVAPSVQPLQRHQREEKDGVIEIEMVRGGDGYDKAGVADALINRNREGGGPIEEDLDRAERRRRRKERAQQRALNADALPPPIIYFPFFTIFIICAFVAIFIGTMYQSGSTSSTHWIFDSWYNNPMYGPNVDGLIYFGAKYTPYIISTYISTETDWWRVITPIVLHAGIIHIIINCGFFSLAAVFLERSFSALRIAPIWLIAGIWGELLSALLAPTLVGVGASAGTCGLLGAHWADFFHHHQYITDMTAKRIYFAILATATVFAFPLGIFTYVDNWANLGGFIAGVLAGNIILAGLVADPATGKHVTKWPLAIGSAVLLVALYGVAAGLLWGYHSLEIDARCPNCHYVGCIDTAYWTCESNLPVCTYDNGIINC